MVVKSSNIPLFTNGESDQDMIATCCQSILINTHGINGILYRIGEDLLLKHSYEETIVKATDNFAICNCDEHQIFVKGNTFSLMTLCIVTVDVQLCCQQL